MYSIAKVNRFEMKARVLTRLDTVNYFCKKLHLKYFIGF